MHIKRLLLLGATLGAALLLRLRRRLIARWLDLPPPAHAVRAARGVPVTLADGVVLQTDVYHPAGAAPGPAVLIRSPYGRGLDALPAGLMLIFLAQRFAERGYRVVVQTTRGQFDSGGAFTPYVHEQQDGLDTIAWIERQPWFNGVLGAWGPSYLGIVQWAAAVRAPESLKAIVPIITASQVSTLQFPDGAFALETSLGWATSTGVRQDDLPRRERWARRRQADARLRRALQHLPLLTADEAAAGVPVPFYRTWLQNPPWDDAAGFWARADHQQAVGQTRAAAHLITGWYDIWLRELLADYAALRAAGQAPYLTIGPWPHVSAGPLSVGLREGLAWLDAHLKGDAGRLRESPVRVYVMGAEAWRELAAWPPPAETRPLFLQPGGGLAWQPAAADAAPARFRYDPADPTPIAGGTRLASGAGRQDQAAIEARPDVLLYTSAPLEAGLEIAGPVRLTLHVRSSLVHTDFVGRLCDVDGNGRSLNVCDGLCRIAPGQGEAQADGSLRIEIDLWAVAYRFLPGHRIRLQVCGGAHPRWSRNGGGGEPIALATRLLPAEQTIFHDAQRPSAVLLPVVAVT